jgi:hypothetical protein
MLISLIKDRKFVKIDHRLMIPKETSHVLVEYKSQYEILLDNADKANLLYIRVNPLKKLLTGLTLRKRYTEFLLLPPHF